MDGLSTAESAATAGDLAPASHEVQSDGGAVDEEQPASQKGGGPRQRREQRDR